MESFLTVNTVCLISVLFLPSSSFPVVGHPSLNMVWICNECQKVSFDYRTHWNHCNRHDGGVSRTKQSKPVVSSDNQTIGTHPAESFTTRANSGSVHVTHNAEQGPATDMFVTQDDRSHNGSRLLSHDNCNVTDSNDHIDSNSIDAIDDVFGNIVDVDLLLEDDVSISEEEAGAANLSIATTHVHPSEAQLLYLMTKYKIPADAFPFFM